MVALQKANCAPAWLPHQPIAISEISIPLRTESAFVTSVSRILQMILHAVASDPHQTSHTAPPRQTPLSVWFAQMFLQMFSFFQPYEPGDDWSEHISSSGKKYYYNCRTEVSQWEKPKEWLER